MPSMWVIKNNILYTTNNGYDKMKTPLIPLSEFLEDCSWVSTFKIFNKLVNDMIKDEIECLPPHMKVLALNDIKIAKQNYLEKLKK